MHRSAQCCPRSQPRPRPPSWSGGDGGSWVPRESPRYPCSAYCPRRGPRPPRRTSWNDGDACVPSPPRHWPRRRRKHGDASASSQVPQRRQARPPRARPGRRVLGRVVTRREPRARLIRLSRFSNGGARAPCRDAPVVSPARGRKLSGALVRRCRRLVDRVIARLSSRGHARDIHSPQLSHNTDLHQLMGDTFNLTHPQSQGTIPSKQSDTYVTKQSHNRHFRLSTSVF